MNYRLKAKGLPCNLTQVKIPVSYPPLKLFIAMKLTVLLTLAFNFQLLAGALAQKINIRVQDKPFKSVLREIQQQSGYSFIMENHYMRQARPVTLTLSDADISEALPILFAGQPFGYSIRGKVVSAAPLTEAKPESPIKKIQLVQDTIWGTVTDSLGNPLAGVTVRIVGTNKGTTTNPQGRFQISESPENATLSFHLLGHNDVVRVASPDMNVSLFAVLDQLSEAEVTVNTGYQNISKERAVGSFEVINNELLNRSVSTNFQDRLRGVTTGMRFTTNDQTIGRIQTNPNNRNTGITIRGESTYMSSTEPLIVVDNFPFEGELSSLNPNDIENVTILKDASAASIWGARSGNGVIVITTKRGKRNEKMKLDFVSNVTVSSKPDLFYSQRFLPAKDFIEVEQYLFDQGYFNFDINNSFNYPVVSPSVEIMALVRSGTISAEDGQARLAALAQYDVRNDYEKYVYQNAVNQQYSLGISGGTDNLTYRLSTGLDRNREELIRNGFNRIVVNSLNTYSPVKNLQITAGINYSRSVTSLNNEAPDYIVNNFNYQGSMFPYTRLADDQGNHLDVLTKLRESYLQQAEERGYLDWRYRPLDEIYLSDNTTKVNSIMARLSASYQIIPQLAIEVNYQNEQQRITGRNHRSQDTYYVRDMINTFTVYNAEANALTSNYPLGGMLSTNNYDWSSNTLRGQLNYNQQFGKHAVYSIAGSEIRELKTNGFSQTFIGYDDQFGTSVSTLDFVTFYPTSPSGASRLLGIGSIVTGIDNRFISYYANASYSYDNKYILSLSGRRDGANLFGAKTNNRFTPLWSAGAGWKISRESFYNTEAIPYLQLRATYGFNGNTYSRGTALLTARYSIEGMTGAQTLVNLTAPNSELKWERVENINLGLDFHSKDQIISGTIEYYIKNGIDLVQPTDLPPQTGFLTYTANTAKTRTQGMDVNLTARILDRKLKWSTNLLLSVLKDEIVRYDAPYTSISTSGGIEGKPLHALFAYKWEGLNPETGAPVGLLNGTKSEDYGAIYNNLDPEQLVYTGSALPTTFGALRNDFSYKDFTLSFNILYSLNYFFRRPSISTNYTGMLTAEKHTDYSKRWQNPGDELTTSVPSLVYPADANRSNFYQYSEALITSGDHIRLQDIQFSYDFTNLIPNNNKSKKLYAFIYANNLGIIWRKNDYNIDPNSIYYYPEPLSVSLGINANF